MAAPGLPCLGSEGWDDGPSERETTQKSQGEQLAQTGRLHLSWPCLRQLSLEGMLTLQHLLRLVQPPKLSSVSTLVLCSSPKGLLTLSFLLLAVAVIQAIPIFNSTGKLSFTLNYPLKITVPFSVFLQLHLILLFLGEFSMGRGILYTTGVKRKAREPNPARGVLKSGP